MSSKKATSKAPAKASASEKKSAPKKAPAKAKPAAKAAPAKKAAAPAKKAAAKPAPAKKPAAKPAPVKKAAPAKAPAKAAPAKAAPAKKAAAKKDVPAKKAPAKAVKPAPAAKKPVAKPAAKPVKNEVSKKPVPVKKVEPAVEAPAAKKAKAPAKAPVEQKKPVEENVEKKASKDVEKKPSKAAVEVSEKHESKKASAKVEYPYAVLLEGGKKPCKFIMFIEIDEQEERANKKKVTSEMKSLEKKPTSAIRHKISLAEETQEELTERILKELEEQNAAFTREAATQICTRCNKNLVSPEFWVDKHLGYCEECAAILHLGQSKEARKVEYQLGAMGGDSLDEVDDDDIEGPDAADLKEAEEELAEFDD